MEAMPANDNEQKVVSNPAIDALVEELEHLDQNNFPALHALAECELFRLRGGVTDSIDIIDNKRVKVRTKVNIPQEQFPNVNFVGKLLGPKGTILRQIQEETKTKMAILGSGSLRDGNKEQELLGNGDPKYQHLKQRLHLQIDSLATPVEAYYRLSHAMSEVRKVMMPETGEVPPPPWGMGAPMAMPVVRGAHSRGRPSRGRGFSAGPAGFLPPPGGAFHAQNGHFKPRGRGSARGGRGRGRGAAKMNGNVNGASGDYVDTSMDASAYGYGYGQEGEYPTGYEDFGAGYGQTEAWGKMAGGGENRGRGRGRGRPHPYGRPAAKEETA